MNWYFTFGFSTTNRNCYVQIKAASYGEARALFTSVHGDKFAFQYSEEDFAGQPETYGLCEVPLGTLAEPR